NTHTPETVTISGKKTWNDVGNQDGKRPNSITVKLLADGQVVKTQTVTADGNAEWKYTFEGMPVYAEGEVGRKIVYTVEEEAVEGYTATYAEEGYDITNTHTPETVTISGKKTWNDASNQDGKRPTSITINLLANGQKVDSVTVYSNGTDEWSYSFADMPKYEAGKEIQYSVAEERVTGYSTKYEGNDIINSYTPGKTSVTVTKVWDDAKNQDGKRPESIVVNLLADGVKKDSAEVVADENDVWKYTFENLPEYSNGKKIVYTVEEERVEEYDANVEQVDGTNDFVISNTHAPEVFSLTITKEWADYDNALGIRPENVTAYLIANGEEYLELTLSEMNGWEVTVDDLPVYSNGQEIEYVIAEAEVKGYEASYAVDEDGVVITNTLVDDTIAISGKKTWDDEDDKDGIRPESIVIRLLADGDEMLFVTVTADEDGEWNWDFGELPLFNEDGKLITYTITEDEVEGYTAEIKGFDVTNIHVVEEEEEEAEEDDEVPKTGDNRSDMQRVLLFAGLALMMIGLISGVSLKKRMNH
ncbi:MAG: Cna B-type domain-containing protein, partial [Candidatus Faecivicinus sp.]